MIFVFKGRSFHSADESSDAGNALGRRGGGRLSLKDTWEHKSFKIKFTKFAKA